MAEVLKDGEFWLPPEFITDDDILMVKENFNGNGLCFPRQLPYELPDSESDEEDISELTRQFSRSTLHNPQKISFPPSNQEAKWVYSGSPQSTLSAAGSWSVSSNGSPSGPSQNPSPPTTPFVHADDTWDLIYAAAGQVARMKMSMNLNRRDGPTDNRAFLAPQYRSVAPANYNNCVAHSLCHHNHISQMRPETAIKLESERWLPALPPLQVNQGTGLRIGVESNGRSMGSSLSAWPCPQVQNHRLQNQLPVPNNPVSMNRTVFLGASGGGDCGGRPVKRERAGTGVFIPRGPSESRRKPAITPPLLSTRAYRAKPQTQFTGGLMPNMSLNKPQTHLTGGLMPNMSLNYDLLIARRNAAMAQQQQRQNIRPEVMMKHHDVLLPQEWTY